jgi:V8-like Glu-specific endopeptidase
MPAKPKKTAGYSRPMSVDELAAFPDVAATEATPEEVSRALAVERLHIHGVHEPHVKKSGERGHETWSLDLPPGSSLGQPGRSGERLARASHKQSARKHTDVFRPNWAAQSFQARRAGEAFQHVPMRRRKGAMMDPYYGVYPPDQRQVYFPNAYPWRCIGRIFTWTNWAGGGGWNWWGSGVLVGPRHVLTAGHVCPWGSGSWAMQFVPNYWNGSPLLGAGSQSWTSDYRGWNTNDTVAANDIAVIRLYDPIGSWLGWMGTKVYDSGWNGGNYWTLAGYPAAIAGGERPSSQSGIPVLDTDGDGDAEEIEHHGSATGGDSGGPFFGFWSDGPYAVGTTSGGETISGGFLGIGDEDNNIEAGGLALVDLVIWTQSNWP